jgi:Zn-dependent M28 family amino/carboxypeptidase
MLRISKAFVGVALFAFFSSFGPDQDAVIQTIHPEAIRSHVTFLADDLLEGRGTGTRGFDLAAKYIGAQFEAMGLQPGGLNASFFQPIPFRTAVPVPGEITLQIERNGKSEPLRWGLDYFGRGDPAQTVATIRGQVVLVEHGVTASDFGIDDYKGIEAHGKIVAFFSGAPEALPSAERAHYGNLRTKLDNAIAHGAIGAIQVWDIETERVRPFVNGLRQSVTGTTAWLDQNGVPGGRRQDIRLLATLSQEGTRKLLGDSPEAGKAAVPPISLSMTTTSQHSDVVSPNIVGMLRGSDPQLRDEYVIYSAHADHLGIGPAVNGDRIYNGAADNALGIGALIEIARAFLSLNPRPRRSIIFLAVTGEEKGLLGSDYFAENPTVPRTQIVANVNMDGVNHLFDYRAVVMQGADHSSLGRIAAQAAGRMGVMLEPDPEPEQQYFVRSDQYSFVKYGIPAIWQSVATKAVDRSIDALQVLNESRRLHYHQPSDDLSQTFDWNVVAKATRINFVLGYLIAQETARPRWNKGDFFGKTFGNVK